MTTPEQPAPKPDRQTGQPRPPQAPVDPGWTPVGRATDLGPEEPPLGHGPALEWFAETRSTMWGAAVFALAVFLVFSTWKWGGFGWAKVWWLWPIVLGCASLFLIGRANSRLTAGADWLIVHGVCVNTYRLREIRVTGGVGTYHLELTDTSGRKIDIQVPYLQRNRELWDLVYNGILHSIVHHGADVNRRAMARLQLQAVIRKPPVR